VFKWLFYLVWCSVVIAKIKHFRREHPERFEHNPEAEATIIHLDHWLLIWMLQHVIFILLRPVFMVAFVILTCFMDQGEAYSAKDDLSWSIISYDYIKNMRERAKNEDGYKMGFDELEFRSHNEEIHRIVTETERKRKNPKELRLGFRDGLVELMGFSKDSSTCAVCAKSMEAGACIVKLGCNPACCLHDSCYKALLKYYKEQGEDACCPICQKEIDEDAVEDAEMEGFLSPEKKDDLAMTLDPEQANTQMAGTANHSADKPEALISVK